MSDGIRTELDPTIAAVSALLISLVVATLLVWGLLGEAASPREWLGIVLVVGGVIILQWR